MTLAALAVGLLVFAPILLFVTAPNWIRRSTLATLQKRKRPP